MQHWFASDFTPNTVDVSLLDTSSLTGDPCNIQVHQFILNINEKSLLKANYQVLCARILQSEFKFFKWFKDFVPSRIYHNLRDSMSLKSIPCHLPLILKNEASYADCCDIMDMYTELLQDCYTKAKIFSKIASLSLISVENKKYAVKKKDHVT